MDIIKLARELGKTLQADERYLKLKLAQQANDENEELKQLIGEFNLKRVAINNEASKEDRDEKKLETLNNELRECYASIMQNEDMKHYNEAKLEMDTLLRRITAIIMQSADGEDPETTDYQESCSGSCSTCGGCH